MFQLMLKLFSKSLSLLSILSVIREITLIKKGIKIYNFRIRSGMCKRCIVCHGAGLDSKKTLFIDLCRLLLETFISLTIKCLCCVKILIFTYQM